MLKKLLLLFVGVALIVIGVMTEIAWLGICFGTVIIGLVMLVFSAQLLIIPITFIVMPGFLMVSAAYLSLKE